ncbi:MAG: HpcH/HpaI aldolase [Polaromonas sp.]|nr:HpcH/HpaI aldolase [Polaromonas sp.]
MIDLLTITNSPEQAWQCDQLAGMRIFVDLERKGKAERQAGRNTFISSHQMADVARVKAVLKASRLMVRVNPIDLADLQATAREVDEVINQGADLIMLPMFSTAEELRHFSAILNGRVPVVPLLETAGALHSMHEWIETDGIHEVFVGLNDLHLSLGCRFMFEPLLQGHVDRVAKASGEAGLRFGFGGIARMDEGLLAGRDVLGEHLRLGSQAVILSRTFNRTVSNPQGDIAFEDAVAELRKAERDLLHRLPQEVERDHLRVDGLIRQLAAVDRHGA